MYVTGSRSRPALVAHGRTPLLGHVEYFVAGSADLRSSGQAVHLQYKLPSQPVALEGADRMEITSASRFLQHECETERHRLTIPRGAVENVGHAWPHFGLGEVIRRLFLHVGHTGSGGR